MSTGVICHTGLQLLVDGTTADAPVQEDLQAHIYLWTNLRDPGPLHLSF